MKAIQCEMCGSHDLIKKDGVFVCENCGTKYTLEEAKKLMIDGVVSVSIDTSKKEQDILKIIKTAFDAGNYQEVYDSATKLVEMNPNLWRGWFYKWIGAGYLSEKDFDRFAESLTYYQQMIDVCSDEEYEEVNKISLDEFIKMIEYLFGMHCINFQTDINGENAYNMSTFLSGAFGCIDGLVEDAGYGYCEAYELKTKLSHKFFKTLQAAKENSDARFGKSKSSRTDEKWEIWMHEQIEIESNAEDLINSEIRPQDFEPYFNFMSRVVTDRIHSCSYDYIPGDGYVKSLVLSDDAIRTSKNDLKNIMNRKPQILAEANKRAAEYHKARNEKYWEEHKEEKEQLLKEKDSLLNNINDFDSQIKDIDNSISLTKQKYKVVLSEEEKVISTERQINIVKSDLKKYSLFDFKGKAPTKERIKELKRQLENESALASSARKRYDASVKKEIDQLVKQKNDLLSLKEIALKKVNSINEGLNKNR